MEKNRIIFSLVLTISVFNIALAIRSAITVTKYKGYEITHDTSHQTIKAKMNSPYTNFKNQWYNLSLAFTKTINLRRRGQNSIAGLLKYKTNKNNEITISYLSASNIDKNQGLANELLKQLKEESQFLKSKIIKAIIPIWQKNLFFDANFNIEDNVKITDEDKNESVNSFFNYEYDLYNAHNTCHFIVMTFTKDD